MEDTDALLAVMNRLRIPPRSADRTGMNPFWASVSKWMDEDHGRMIEVADVLMEIRMTDYLRLDQILSEGGSLSTAIENRIEERVDPVAKGALGAAIQPKDHASAELSEAWSKAYGRQKDASDAWDHAIKAVEAILRGIISPANTQATLGTLIRDLGNGAHKFKFVLANDLGGVETFLAMLQLMWPNPDRHGDLHVRHTPSIEEARAVVQLAVTIVQWGRDGQILRR
jgi:hypothetical protein